jgi:hypothetical protein
MPSSAKYPAISRLVEATCGEFGIPNAEHASFRARIASHFRPRTRDATITERRRNRGER